MTGRAGGLAPAAPNRPRARPPTPCDVAAAAVRSADTLAKGPPVITAKKLASLFDAYYATGRVRPPVRPARDDLAKRVRRTGDSYNADLDRYRRDSKAESVDDFVDYTKLK